MVAAANVAASAKLAVATGSASPNRVNRWTAMAPVVAPLPGTDCPSVNAVIDTFTTSGRRKRRLLYRGSPADGSHLGRVYPAGGDGGGEV